MEKNGVISLRLEDLVEMLDARKTINVFKVDSNGALLIDKPDQFKKDTAVWPYMVGLIIE